MIWETIDNLTDNVLSSRAKELRRELENCPRQTLVVFHKEANEVFQNLFTPPIYHLYCVVFEGEANGSGLTDFCSNLMLSGRSLVERILLNPDNFVDVRNLAAFNEDSGLDVSSIAWHILAGRYGEDVAEDVLKSAGVELTQEVWGKLEKQVGELTFEPNWRIAKSTLPQICERLGKK